MKFDRFDINAKPVFSDAYCECGNTLSEVSNGWLSITLFCYKCNNIYIPKLVKITDKDGKYTKRILEDKEKENKIMEYKRKIYGIE